MQDAISGAIKKNVKRGRVAGTLVTEENVDRYLDLGVRCIGIAYLAWIAKGAQGFLEKAAGPLGPTRTGGSKKWPLLARPRLFFMPCA